MIDERLLNFRRTNKNDVLFWFALAAQPALHLLDKLFRGDIYEVSHAENSSLSLEVKPSASE